MQQATSVSLQTGFSGLHRPKPDSPNLIEIKEETVEGLGGFEPPTCGLGNRCAQEASRHSPVTSTSPALIQAILRTTLQATSLEACEAIAKCIEPA